MAELLAPGLYFQEAAAAPAIAPLRTDIAFFAGMAERGPVGIPVRITGWEHFRARYGDFQSTSFLAYAIKAFFENGGAICWIIRVAAPERTMQARRPQPADRLSSSVASAEGLVRGAVATLTQTRQTQTTGSQPADRLSSIVLDASPFPPRALVEFRQGTLRSFRHVKARDVSMNRLTWDKAIDAAFDFAPLADPIALIVVHRTALRVSSVAGTTIGWEGTIPAEYNLTTPIDITTGASKSQVDLYDMTSRATLRVRATEEGIWGNRLTVHLGHSSRFATRTLAKTQPGGSTGLIVESVTGFHAHQLVRIFQPGAGVPEFRILEGVNVARQIVSWTAPLPGAFVLTDAANGTRPITVESLEFTLSVALDGTLRELHDDLSLIEEDRDHYVTAAVARTSRLIEVEVLPNPGTPEQRLPDVEAANLIGATARLGGGRDGIAAIHPQQFLDALATERDVDEIAILAAPDLMIEPRPPALSAPRPVPVPDPCRLEPQLPPEAPPPEPVLAEQAPTFTVDEIERVQQAMLLQCEQKMDRFAVLDPPPPPRINSFSQVQSWRHRFDSKFGALYHPWVLVPDPLRTENRPVRRVPPSGVVAGIYAEVDLELGVHHAPANQLIRFALGPVEDVSEAEQEILNPLGINCLRELPGRGFRVWGARTVSSDSQWRYVNVRRLMSLIEEALEDSLAWAVFQPNNRQLRGDITASVNVFLEALWEAGALVGRTAEEAFYIRCDEENNPPDEMALGRLLIEIGVAPVRPAEFVVIRIGRIEDSFEIEERGVQSYGR